MRFIATFYTQAAALLSNRALKNAGIESKAGPVPRELSSSCGTCVHYQSEEPMISFLDADVESVYEDTGNGYRVLLHRD